MKSAILVATGILEILVGAAWALYWLLFESWSHDYLSQAYQERQALAAVAIPLLWVAGAVSILLGVSARRS